MSSRVHESDSTLADFIDDDYWPSNFTHEAVGDWSFTYEVVDNRYKKVIAATHRDAEKEVFLAPERFLEPPSSQKYDLLKTLYRSEHAPEKSGADAEDVWRYSLSQDTVEDIEEQVRKELSEDRNDEIKTASELRTDGQGRDVPESPEEPEFSDEEIAKMRMALYDHELRPEDL